MEHIHPQLADTLEITLRLDGYDDIFSDFDMRPYSQRAVSVDFLDEIRRATSDKDNSDVELILNVPEHERKEYDETIIKERLAAHFKRHYHLLMQEKRHVLRLNISMVVVGIIFMIIATLIVFNGPSKNLFLSFLLIFLEPAAWFLLWEGMDHIIFTSKSLDPELNFYRKMSNAHERMYFKSY